MEWWRGGAEQTHGGDGREEVNNVEQEKTMETDEENETEEIVRTVEIAPGMNIKD